MEVSVVVPTYNGEKKIGFLLDALLRQTFKNFELVVVVDGSTDNTEKILDAYKNRFSAFTIINQQNSGRSKVRNRGAKEAKGDLIIFFDDDMIPAADSISCHINFHILNRVKSILVGNQIEEHNSRYTDVQNYKAFLSKKWLSPYPKGITELSLKNLFFSAANCSIKRHDFEFLKGFDERLTDAEDYDLALRGLKRGIGIFFDKNNVATHNDKMSATSYIRRLRAYHSAHVKLSQIHDIPMIERARPLYKKVLYRLFAFRFWVRLIDSDILKYVFPSAMRFKFYDLVFQSLSVEFSNTELN